MAEEKDLVNALVQREIAPRSREHADPVINRALTVLGQDLNPIKAVTPSEIAEIYGRHDLKPGQGINGFMTPKGTADPTIYINVAGDTYKDAAKIKPSSRYVDNATLKLAALLAHEQVHATDGGAYGEYAARRIESDLLRQHLKELKDVADPAEMRNYLDRLDFVVRAFQPKEGYAVSANRKK